MSNDEKKAIRRKFCSNATNYHTFNTEQEGLDYLEKVRESWNWDKPRGQIVPCSNCGCYHFLREYIETLEDERQYPNTYERLVILQPKPMKADYSRKRTKRKMIGRYRNVRKFPKPKRMFGTVPDNGWFDRIVSARFVCFTCHKSWRNFNRKADKRRMTYEDSEKQMQVCPHCGSSLQRVYPMFRAPKRNDTKAWARLENRYRKKV